MNTRQMTVLSIQPTDTFDRSVIPTFIGESHWVKHKGGLSRA
jgi:hypothetical protein